MRKLVFIDLKHYLCEPLSRQSKTQNHHSEPLAKESLTKLARDISLSLNMTISVAIPYYDTEYVNAIYSSFVIFNRERFLENILSPYL